MASRKSVSTTLSARERDRLLAWAADATAPARALRSRIVLACADGSPDARVAASLGVSRDTVRKWRSRFTVGRLVGLGDAPRPGAPRTISDEHVARVVARTLLETPSDGRPRWSTRSMAAATGLSQSAVSRIWRRAGLTERAAENGHRREKL
jgi:transposase